MLEEIQKEQMKKDQNLERKVKSLTDKFLAEEATDTKIQHDLIESKRAYIHHSQVNKKTLPEEIFNSCFKIKS